MWYNSVLSRKVLGRCVEDMFEYFEKENPIIYFENSNPFLKVKDLVNLEEFLDESKEWKL